MRDYQRQRVYDAEREAFGPAAKAFEDTVTTEDRPSLASNIRPDGRYSKPKRTREYFRDIRKSEGVVYWWKIVERHREWQPGAFRTVRECQQFVDEVTSGLLWPGDVAQHVKVRDGRRRKRACAGIDYIKLPRWARARIVILHELAHIAGGDQHGPRFARWYLSALSYYVGGEQAAALHYAFRAYGVDVAARQEEAA